jgi:hypothetical protein
LNYENSSVSHSRDAEIQPRREKEREKSKIENAQGKKKTFAYVKYITNILIEYKQQKKRKKIKYIT